MIPSPVVEFVAAGHERSSSGPECPICRSPQHGILTVLKSDGRLAEIHVCSGCGHGVDPAQLAKRPGEFGPLSWLEADPVRPDPRRCLWPQRYTLLKQEIERLGIARGTVLDIGCGNGRWLGALGDGWQKYGIERSPIKVELARLHTAAEVFCGSFEEYAPPVAGFDLITAFAFIEHLSDPRLFLRWCHRLLRRGGWLLLMTGDRQSRTAATLGVGWPLYQPVGHAHFFSSDSLSRLLDSELFEVRRRDWRYMPWGRAPLVLQVLMKWQEAMGRITTPKHDHLYVFAQKRSLAPPHVHVREEAA
jgi:SAM-dependent methyltransferase